MNNKVFCIFTFCMFLMHFSVAMGKNISENTQSFDEWKQTFANQAIQEGVNEAFLMEVLPHMQLLSQVVQSDRKQPEFHLTFWDYTDKVFSKKRLKDGQKMMKQYADLLDKAEQKYGVPAKYITAFWGLETAYGAYKGNVDTLNALTTLAYDKRRRTFFTKELIAFLKIMHQEKLTDVKGSWAGAFGHFQFMPTTFMAYAVDADGDGRKDIINSLPDAIESAANYLSHAGWDNTVKWGREVKLPDNLDWERIHQEKTRPIREWHKLGIVPANGMVWPISFYAVTGRLEMPMGVNGPVFLVYKNYDVTGRWNRSDLYALSIGLLSDALIMGDYQIYADRKNLKFSYADTKEIQELLTKKGYYTGVPDGVLGRGTRQAIRAYQKDNLLPQDGYATKELLNKIRGM